jgi:5-methylcytosine-specific restriction endonuclease McrA
MSNRQCAYCGSSGPLTREYLWPASLHQRLMEANNDPKGRFWLRRANAEIEGEPKLRDVCQACNNGVLSQLDAYIFRNRLAGICRSRLAGICRNRERPET